MLLLHVATRLQNLEIESKSIFNRCAKEGSSDGFSLHCMHSDL